MPLLQPLLRPHKLPDPHRDIRKQIPSTQSSSPIRLAPASIIIHARTTLDPALARTRHPCLAALRRPLLDLLAVLVPHTVDAAGHAAVVRFRGARWDKNASDQGRFEVQLGAALCGACKP